MSKSPWHIEKSDDGGQYCVIKDSDDSKAGCHDTRGEAEEQLKALYAAEPMSAEAWESSMERVMNDASSEDD